MLFGMRPRLAIALVALASIVGCAAGYRTTTTNGHERVYKVDGEGNKNLVYEIPADGTLIVHDESDPRVQQLLAAQEQEKQLQALEEERVALIQKAPKRAHNDPIRVALHPVDVEEKLSQAQHSEGALEEAFRQEFAGDKLIRIVNPAVSKGAEITQVLQMLTAKNPTRAASAGPAADVEVVTRAYVEEKNGYNKSTKKLGTYAALVYEATIRSNYLPMEYTVKEEGNIFRNGEVTKRLAAQIKSVIKNKIGPTIPADRSL